MRTLPFVLALALTSPAPAVAALADPQALEQAWHRCVRDAFAHQPSGQKRSDQRPPDAFEYFWIL
ncbi:hypothetical protein [Methylobacterium sp. J-067]|uniref:hypothetical protein n=1 Tax=Methylobacterium sp. J-067 TaxID=2836648 RepID=UPI001FBA2C46|nr:hypothetical protein [Methylobacterium sp. J-067]MCJ2023621.1 hypothetical protein [Methylobacterium sp. J-067]